MRYLRRRITQHVAYTGLQSGVLAVFRIPQRRAEAILPPGAGLLYNDSDSNDDSDGYPRIYAVLAEQQHVGIVAHPCGADVGVLGNAIASWSARVTRVFGASFREALLIIPRVRFGGIHCSYIDSIYLDSRVATVLGRHIGLRKYFSRITSTPSRYQVDALGLQVDFGSRRSHDGRHEAALQHVRQSNASGCLSPSLTVIPGFRTCHFRFGHLLDARATAVDGAKITANWRVAVTGDLEFAIEFSHQWEMEAYSSSSESPMVL